MRAIQPRKKEGKEGKRAKEKSSDKEGEK